MCFRPIHRYWIQNTSVGRGLEVVENAHLLPRLGNRNSEARRQLCGAWSEHRHRQLESNATLYMLSNDSNLLLRDILNKTPQNHFKKNGMDVINQDNQYSPNGKARKQKTLTTLHIVGEMTTTPLIHYVERRQRVCRQIAHDAQKEPLYSILHLSSVTGGQSRVYNLLFNLTVKHGETNALGSALCAPGASQRGPPGFAAVRATRSGLLRHLPCRFRDLRHHLHCR